MLARRDGQGVRAELLEGSLTLAQEIGDRMGLAWSLHMHGLMAQRQGDYAEAIVRSEESLRLYRELGDRWGIAASLLNLGNVMRSQGRYERAAAHYDESLTVFREAGDKRGMAFVFNYQGMMAQHQGDYDQARVLAENPCFQCFASARRCFQSSGPLENHRILCTASTRFCGRDNSYLLIRVCAILALPRYPAAGSSPGASGKGSVSISIPSFRSSSLSRSNFLRPDSSSPS